MILLATLLESPSGILLGTWWETRCDSVGDTIGESVRNFVGTRWETRSMTWLENLTGSLWAIWLGTRSEIWLVFPSGTPC